MSRLTLSTAPLAKNLSLRAGDRRHWCGNPYPPTLCLRRPPFFLRRKKRGKERRQNQGFEILSAAEVPSASVLPTPRVGMCKFCALLSHRLCVPIRDALCACAALARRGRTSASTAFGASGRRPLRRAIGKRCVGAGVLDGPHRTCANFPINRRAGCPQPADWPCAVLPAGHTGPALQGKRIPTSLRSSE